MRAYYRLPGALFLACLSHEGALVTALVALGAASGAAPPFPFGLDAGGARFEGETSSPFPATGPVS